MALNPYSRYPSKVGAPTAGYPYGVPRNVVTPGDGLGTPWEEDIVKDIFGFQQELLSKAGITPSGTADAVNASQYMEALKKTAGYPSMIVPMALNADPATLGLRVIKCDGSGILRANYADLDTAAWVGSGANATAGAFYRADNSDGSSRNNTGAYLILPDLQGQFLRGRDPLGAVDPEGATRNLFEIQDWALYDHLHTIDDISGRYEKFNGSNGSGSSFVGLQPGSLPVDIIADGLFTGNGSSQTQIPADNRSTDEVRPTNVDVDFYVWY